MSCNDIISAGTGMPMPQSYPPAGSTSYPAATPPYPPQSQASSFQTTNTNNAAPTGRKGSDPSVFESYLLSSFELLVGCCVVWLATLTPLECCLSLL